MLPGKKKVWNWSSYLEEEQMPAAPQKLFREVGSFFHSLTVFFRQHYRISGSVEVGLETTLKPALVFLSCFGRSRQKMFVFCPGKQAFALGVSSQTRV